jgi:hypothetical protein
MIAATVLALTTIVRGFYVDLQIDRSTKSVRGAERIELAAPDELRLPLKGQSVEAVTCGQTPPRSKSTRRCSSSMRARSTASRSATPRRNRRASSELELARRRVKSAIDAGYDKPLA